MMLKEKIQRHSNEFKALCQSHRVKELYAFGSSITDKFNEQSSDIDLVVEINEDDPIKRGEILLSLWDQLETFFGRRVDLLTDTSIKNPVLRKNIEATKTLIYDGRGQEVRF